MSDVAYDACDGCSEPFSKDYGKPVLCGWCYRRTPEPERINFLRADRATEQSVAAAKARHAKRPKSSS